MPCSATKLEEARIYEAREGAAIPAEARPLFHLTPYVGWMNDPNGFCFYQGAYHLFYQYYPYDTVWGPMHWGHAVSEDLLHWEELPIALYPDQPYESGQGCFSGSAVEKDGRLAFDYPEKSIGRVKLFYGNFDVCIKALTYVLTLGRTGIPEAAMNAVLNANYMRVKLAEKFTMAYDEICMHEFVMSLVDLHKETGVSALDLAKGMLDYGLHPPTMYFPLIVHEALMVEPCETESKETMDEVCDIYGRLFDLAYSDPDALHTAPHDTPVRRLDEVGAARNMILRYSFAQ